MIGPTDDEVTAAHSQAQVVALVRRLHGLNSGVAAPRVEHCRVVGDADGHETAVERVQFLRRESDVREGGRRDPQHEVLGKRAREGVDDVPGVDAVAEEEAEVRRSGRGKSRQAVNRAGSTEAIHQRHEFGRVDDHGAVVGRLPRTRAHDDTHEVAIRPLGANLELDAVGPGQSERPPERLSVGGLRWVRNRLRVGGEELGDEFGIGRGAQDRERRMRRLGTGRDRLVVEGERHVGDVGEREVREFQHRNWRRRLGRGVGRWRGGSEGGRGG